MSAAADDAQIAAAARAANLADEQILSRSNLAASWAMDDRALSDDELTAAAEVIAGRVSVADARRRLGV